MAASSAALAQLGLAVGSIVRFRRSAGDRWVPGRAFGVESDGSIDLRDGRGRSRSIPISCIEVAERGPRGARVWTPLIDVAARAEQLDLFDAG